MPAESMSLYLLDDTQQQLVLYRNRGSMPHSTVALADIPPSLRSALDAPRTVRAGDLTAGTGMSPQARSGVYTALRARGSVTGALVVESENPEGSPSSTSRSSTGSPRRSASPSTTPACSGASAPPPPTRSGAASPATSTIRWLVARVPRLRDRPCPGRGRARRGDRTDPRRAAGAPDGRHQDIRETLYDLRTDVTDERDLGTTIREHLAPRRATPWVAVELHVDARSRPPRRQEHELWQIALEAITNVERHAKADTVRVDYTVTPARAHLEIVDDGVGLNTATVRTDRYGMVGMRERADSIGAHITIGPNIPRGTRVLVELDMQDEVMG